MPRKQRMYIPGIACHVIQRGNNRDACFYAEDDYQFYLDQLKDACDRYAVSLHAYVLMTNHTQLLMTPSKSDGISKVMQSLGRRYVQYINQTYRRSGTLWEGRHKSSLVGTDDYVLACYRYIELNPVRACMVEHPADYLWSSYRCNAEDEANTLLQPHDAYMRLAVAGDKAQRNCVYKALFKTELDKDIVAKIRTSATCSMPLGDSCFKEQVEQHLNRKIGYQLRGRPRQERQIMPE